MPSLDRLKSNPTLNNIEIFPINIGKDNLKKSKKFFKDLKIKNLNIYFDNSVTLAKDFNLRGKYLMVKKGNIVITILLT